MTASMELFEQLHLRLASNYVDASGKHPEFSLNLAVRMAIALLNEDIKPTILGVRNKALNSKGDPEALIPRRYGGNVLFGVHIVCAVEECIYDPILPHPVSIDDYPGEAFGANLEFEDITYPMITGQLGTLSIAQPSK